MNDDDLLLDQVIARLRDQSVPEMPSELLHPAAAPPAAGMPLLWRTVAASLLAASAACLAVWGWRPPPAPVAGRVPAAASGAVIVKSAIRARPLNLVEPLARLEADLNQIDSDVAALRRRAELLDARRTADLLLARHQLPHNIAAMP